MHPPTPSPAPLMAARSIHKTVYLIYVIYRRSRYLLKSNPYIFASHQQYFSASAEVRVNIYFAKKATNENVFLSSTPRLKNYFIKCTLCRFIWNKGIISRIMETSYFIPAAGSSAKISLLKISRELKVNFNNETLLFCSEPKYLGVTLDRSLTYRRHLKSLRKILTSRVALLRRLAGSGWGAGAATLPSATLALVHSTAQYCAPVWCYSAHTRLDRKSVV